MSRTAECMQCQRRFVAAALQNGTCVACIAAEAVKTRPPAPVAPTPVPGRPFERAFAQRLVMPERSPDEDEGTEEAPTLEEALSANRQVLEREREKALAQVEEIIAEERPKPRKRRTEAERKASLADKEFARRVLARRHLLDFIIRFKPDYQAGWFHRLLCARLEKFVEDVANKKSPRLVVAVPPRHGKSEIVSVNLPPWALGKHPHFEIIAASHTTSLSLNFSRKVRNLVRNPAYKALFETRLAEDSQAAEHWMTQDGGGYVAAGVGSAIVGKGAHILLIDDPVSGADDAENANTRQMIKDWYSTEARTRLAPGGGVLVIMQRWHDDDLAGWLEARGETGEGEKWEVIRFPAIATEDEEFRKAGEALHPERYPLEMLRMLQKSMTPRQWEALYQQNPVPDDGSYFNRGMFRYYDALPAREDLAFYDTWDLAIGQNEANDYTVGATFAVDRDDNAYLVDIQRGRWDSLEIATRIIDTHLRWNSVYVGVEKGHIAMAIGPLLEQMLRERRVYTLGLGGNLLLLPPGKRDKPARARSIQGRMQQHRVLFPGNAPWLASLEGELLRFPNGANDDQVDALAWFGLMLNDLVPPAPAVVAPKRSWRDRLRGVGLPSSPCSAMGA